MTNGKLRGITKMTGIDEQLGDKQMERDHENIRRLILEAGKYRDRDRREHEDRIKQARNDYRLKYGVFFNFSQKPGDDY